MSEQNPSSGESANQSSSSNQENQSNSVIMQPTSEAERLWTMQKTSIRKFWVQYLERFLRGPIEFQTRDSQPFLVFKVFEPNAERSDDAYINWMKEVCKFIDYKMTRYDIYRDLKDGDTPYDGNGAWSLDTFFHWRLSAFDRQDVDRAIYWSSGSGLSQNNGLIRR